MTRLDNLVNEGAWPAKYKPVLWARFRDDIYVPWTHGLDKLIEFHEWMNKQLPGISFTMSQPSENGTKFLDLFVYSKEDQLHTKMYSKDCDDHSYLTPNSCHPTHNIKNIPFSTAHRFFRISSEYEEYIKSKEEYKNYLLLRGYSSKIIDDAFVKIEKCNRLDLIKINDHEQNSDSKDLRVFPLVTDFNPGYPNISKLINEQKYLLDLDTKLKELINPSKLFVSYRGNKTLKDLLIHSKMPSIEANPHKNLNFQPQRNETGMSCPCEKSCYLCKNNLVKTKTVTSYHTNEVFKIYCKIDCNSCNVIYLINDNVCRISYTGCTVDSLKTRFSNHKSHIKNIKHTCELSKHFINNPVIHELDKTSFKAFDFSLKSQISIVAVE